MIYEYALDPSLMIDVNSCRTIFDNFKPEQGKLIADVPQQWIREAYQAINKIPPDQCQPIMRKTLKNNLKILLKQSLCDSRKRIDWNRDEQSLLENMALQNNVYPFSAVITHEAQQDPVQTYSLQNLFITAPDCWNEPTQIHVKRNAKDIVDALAPLLSISTEMILIDRKKHRNICIM